MRIRRPRPISSIVSLVRDETGAAMFEFALVAGFVFIPLVFGIVEFGRLISAKNMVTAAAREGVRYAIVRGSSSGAEADAASVRAYVQSRTPLSPIVVNYTWTGTKEPGRDTATVSVAYTYSPLVKVVPPKVVTGVSRQMISF